MEISAEKTKLMTNSANGQCQWHPEREIKVKGQKLGTVTRFKYLGAVVSDDRSTGHSERKKKKRQTEEEDGRQYQRVDRNGLCQLN